MFYFSTRVPSSLVNVFVTTYIIFDFYAGKNGGALIPSKYPNKLRPSDLDGTVLAHIADKMKFRTPEVTQLVIANTPHPYTATYMLLKRKLDKWRIKALKDDRYIDPSSSALLKVIISELYL